jgi:hypothetical protein
MDARDAHRTFVRPKALIPNERARFQLDWASPWALLAGYGLVRVV